MTARGWSALALAGWMSAGMAQAADGVYWHVCRAESPPIDGVVYAVQTEPTEIRSYDIAERVKAQRPFEPALQAIGAKRLMDADVVCLPAASERAGAVQAARQLRDQLGVAHAADKTRIVEGPWVLALKPGEVAPIVLAGRGETASPATLASGPSTWGLTADDLSRMHNQALLRKAGLPGRKAAMEAAATRGDAYAQYLLAVRPPGQPDDLAGMKKAADQGLVRAIVDYHSELAITPGQDRGPHLAALARMAELGSAHANYRYGMVVLSDRSKPQGSFRAVGSLLLADRLGYASAQLWVAHDLIRSKNPEQQRKAVEAARRAAAQGLAEADAFLREHPMPASSP